MIYYGNELYHHGIKGQKWGERNYQNPDGTLTPEGKKRYREEKRKASLEKKRQKWNQKFSEGKTITVERARFLQKKGITVPKESVSVGKSIATNILASAAAEVATNAFYRLAAKYAREEGRNGEARLISGLGNLVSAGWTYAGIKGSIDSGKAAVAFREGKKVSELGKKRKRKKKKGN